MFTALRLVLWYALVLTLVVVPTAARLSTSWRSMMGRRGLELEAYAREGTDALKPVEGGRFDLELPSDAAAYFFGVREGGPLRHLGRAGSSSINRIGSAGRAPGNSAEGRREKTLRRPAARRCSSGATADLRRAMGLSQVLLAAHCDACRGDFRWVVRGGPSPRAYQANQSDSAGDVRGGFECADCG